MRWARRTLVALNIIVALLVVGAATGYFYLRYRFGQIRTATCAACVPEHSGAAGKAMTVMVVGSDARSDLSAADAAHFCQRADCSDQAGGERSDTLMLIHLDARGGKAALLSIPRDTNVAIAGTSRRDRINAAFAVSPDALIQTIRANFGIDVNHYIVVDFAGFRRIVGAIGGIDVYFPAPARDKLSGLDVAQPGCAHLAGDQALSYVRSRHYEYFESGRWHDDPYSDFSRIQRQQDFIRRVMRKALAVRNPLTANRVLDAAVHDVRIDKGLSEGELLGLGRRLHSLSPADVDMMTLPEDPITVGGAAELRPREPDASLTVRRFLGLDVGAAGAPLPPNTVRVRVLNGSGRLGEATAAARALTDDGFAVAGTGDANAFHYPDTVIRYGSGQLDEARLVESRVLGRVRLQADPTVHDVDVVVTTGTSYGGIRPGPAAAGLATPLTPQTTTPSSVPPATPGGPPPNRGAPLQPQC